MEGVEEKKPRKLARAMSVSDLMNTRPPTLHLSEPFRAAFGEPEARGVWFIWGQSGSGKTTFTLRLCKELAQHGRVLYNSLEEGSSLTMKNAFVRVGMQDVGRRLTLISESIEDLDQRLSKQRSAPIIVIDSFQYTNLTLKEYFGFTKRHRDKLFIFISQANGRNPNGRTAVSVMYDASLKIWVEGYRAISKGRYFGDVGYYDVWPERAAEYWGSK